MSGRYTSFESIFHQLLHEEIDKLVAEIKDRALDAPGAGAGEDAVTIARNYCGQVERVRAFREVQELCKRVRDELKAQG